MTTFDTGLDTAPVIITISVDKASQIAELLECCDAFLRHASMPVRSELFRFCEQHPARPELGWLIDMLGFDTLFLQAKLASAAETATTRGAS